MNMLVNGTSISCPWPSCARCRERNTCFARPHIHLISESEHHTAYFGALDSAEATEGWEPVNVILDEGRSLAPARRRPGVRPPGP